MYFFLNQQVSGRYPARRTMYALNIIGKRRIVYCVLLYRGCDIENTTVLQCIVIYYLGCIKIHAPYFTQVNFCQKFWTIIFVSNPMWRLVKSTDQHPICIWTRVLITTLYGYTHVCRSAPRIWLYEDGNGSSEISWFGWSAVRS